MSDKLSRERLEVLYAEIREELDYGDGHGLFRLASVYEHIAALEAENERLRDVAWRLTKALNDCIEIFVAFDTDTERVIAIEHTVNAALAALDEEATDETR